MSGIEVLPFFVERVELAGPDGHNINRGRANDRTVAVVKKWLILNGELRAARRDTMECCEAVHAFKGDALTIKVVDKPRFEALQATIEARNKEIAVLEQAIKRLDEMGGDWFQDIEDATGSYGRVEFAERQRLANLASSVLSRRMNTGKSAEAILQEDEEYQKFSRIASEQIEDATKRLETLRPKLEEMKLLLESVGC